MEADAIVPSSVDYDANALRKKVNEVQKEISAKKKVIIIFFVFKGTFLIATFRRKNQPMTSLPLRRRSTRKWRLRKKSRRSSRY